MKHTLGLSIETDHHHIQCDTTTVLHVVAEITAQREGVEQTRAPLSVVFAIDVSHSMTGEPILQVRRSVTRLLEMLAPDDRAGIVTFSQSSRVLSPVESVGTHRSALMAAAGQMSVEGWTNVDAGLSNAYAIMPERRPHERCIVLLLSDGMPNRGITTPAGLGELAARARPNITTSTLGFGAGHSEPVLSAIAEGGGGTYHYIRDPALAHVQFASSFGAQGDVVADAVELHVSPDRDVEIVSVVGTPKTRYARSGIIVEVPDLIRGARHRVATRLRVAPGRECGPLPICAVALSYRPAGAPDRLVTEQALQITVTREPSRIALAPLHRVLLLRAEEERREARELADKRRFSDAEARLREAAAMIAQVPGFDAHDGSELAEAWDQLNDDADLYAQHPDESLYQEFRRGQRLGAGGSFDAGAQLPIARAGRAMIEDAAGPLPAARLVELESRSEHPLHKPKNIIGRSRTCDVHIPSAQVSRQSAAVGAEGGDFWIEDLGSSNGVYMNGARILKHQLKDGDVIAVGGVMLRYVATL